MESFILSRYNHIESFTDYIIKEYAKTITNNMNLGVGSIVWILWI